MSSLGMRINLKNSGVSQYADLDINSLCVFNGTVLGANTSGIFSLDGSHDGSIDILSFFQTFSTDFNDFHHKWFRRIQISGDIVGDLDVRVVTDNDKKTAVKVNPLGTLDQQKVIIRSDRCNFGRILGKEGRNVNEADFTVNSIDCDVTLKATIKSTTERLGRIKDNFPVLTLSATSV